MTNNVKYVSFCQILILFSNCLKKHIILIEFFHDSILTLSLCPLLKEIIQRRIATKNPLFRKISV